MSNYNLNCRSEVEILEVIRGHLSDDNISKFQQTCFGHFLKMHPLQFQSHLYMHLIKAQDSYKSIDEAQFNVCGKVAKFGPTDFALVTGLKFGDQPKSIPSQSRIYDTYFKRLGDSVFVVNIKRAFLEIADRESEDSLKLALLLVVFGLLFVKHRTNAKVDLKYFNIVEDLKIFNAFPWGMVSYRFLMDDFRIRLRKRINSHSTNRGSDIDCYGFVFALQCWAFEAMQLVGHLCRVQLELGDLDCQSRIVPWSFKAILIYNAFLGRIQANITNVVNEDVVHYRLVPTETEKMSEAFLSAQEWEKTYICQVCHDKPVVDNNLNFEDQLVEETEAESERDGIWKKNQAENDAGIKVKVDFSIDAVTKAVKGVRNTQNTLDTMFASIVNQLKYKNLKSQPPQKIISNGEKDSNAREMGIAEWIFTPRNNNDLRKRFKIPVIPEYTKAHLHSLLNMMEKNPSEVGQNGMYWPFYSYDESEIGEFTTYLGASYRGELDPMLFPLWRQRRVMNVEWCQNTIGPLQWVGCWNLDMFMHILELKAMKWPEMFLKDWTMVPCSFFATLLELAKRWKENLGNELKKFDWKTRTVYERENLIQGLEPKLGRRIAWSDATSVFGMANIGLNHWVLYEIKPKLKTIKAYDSLCVDQKRWHKAEEEFHLFASALKQITGTDYRVELSVESPRQSNGSDCGMMCIKFFECLVTGLPLNCIDPKQMVRHRVYILVDVYRIAKLSYVLGWFKL